MINRKLFMLVVSAIFSFSGASYAQEVDAKANAFANLYLSICMQNINDFEALRSRLNNDTTLPKFPPEHAAHFLNGQDGDAWPVPHQGQLGNFVIVLPAGKNVCALYARRANPVEVERKFISLVAKAPPPLVSAPKHDEQSETTANGKAHTFSYTWSLPQANRKMLFMLTTTSSDNAKLQAIGTASMISE